MKATFKKTILGVAVAAAMGVSASASADVVTFNYSGLFTMLTSAGVALQNNSLPFYNDPTWKYGLRTQISGQMVFDTATGAGTGTVVPFAFFAGGNAAATSMTFKAIGNGAGGPGTLVLGNMGFNWNGNNGIPVSIVMDAAGMFGAMNPNGSFNVGAVITGSGATPASNGISKGTLPIGAVPIATTTWNTTTIAGTVLGTNPSGTLPLTNDTVGGSPMQTAPFAGFNANFDITKLTVVSSVPPAPVPVPAAAWLLGSGLLGLVGVARRKAA